jgi:hypothetical protein
MKFLNLINNLGQWKAQIHEIFKLSNYYVIKN